MKPSPVRLEHYHLTSLSIIQNDAFSPQSDDSLYPKFADADYQIGVRLGEPEENGSKRFLVHLELSGNPKEGRPFPYSFAIGGDAIIGFHGQEKDDSLVRDLVLVNGASMLYSALREVLLSTTSRFPNGPLMLPSANFIELRQGNKSQQQAMALETTKPQDT